MAGWLSRRRGEPQEPSPVQQAAGVMISLAADLQTAASELMNRHLPNDGDSPSTGATDDSK